jgi:hypothetical protein
LLAHYGSRDIREAEQYIKTRWGEDRGAIDFLNQRGAVVLNQRGAVVPASSGTVTAFNQGIVQTAIDIVGPANAAGAVFSRAGAKVGFDHNSTVFVSGMGADGSKVIFVGQGNPLRNVQFDTSKGCTLTAGMKLGFMITLSNELLQHSNAETLLRMVRRNRTPAPLHNSRDRRPNS